MGHRRQLRTQRGEYERKLLNLPPDAPANVRALIGDLPVRPERELFDADLARALPGPKAGLLAVPQGPGLGVSVDDAALAEVLVEELEH